ncbi:MAG: DUF4335 domain-containing protein [Oscillatoriales cyanobacterium C42_A2020_001]|nr:DUF4335 domain-containing protein [Leptolyngbyaceae cyanobacterium C42_A2020_001]
MTIQRLYSLPNCTLLLEGLGDVISLGQSDARLPMSMVINAECRLAGYEKPLSGGREFLDSLVKAVSQYTQDLLSGLNTTRAANDPAQLVQIQRLSETMHRLRVRSQTEGSSTPSHTTEIDLNTVQFFDLVEAVDQLLADAQTLPDLTLNLKPLSRREIVRERTTGQQIVPAAIGVSGLAAATVLLSLLPVPKVEPPKDLYPVRGQTSQTTSTPSPTTAPPSPTNAPTAAATPAANPSPTTSASPDLKKLEDTLAKSPEITDGAQLTTLSQQLREKLDQSWTSRSAVTQDLTYQVGVSGDGAVLGYKPVNPASLENTSKTPLLNLVPRQVGTASAPLALFKVVFTGSGNVEVAPWRQVMTSPISGISEITETNRLEAILPKLTSQINQNWSKDPMFQEELIFKVRVKQDGTVVDYSPENDAAARYAQDTPLPKLGKPIANGNTAPIEEPIALFKVVIKPPSGALEISPWRGWQN